MQKFILTLALVFASIVPSTLRADSIGLSLVAGGKSVALVQTPILNGTQYTYTDVSLGFFNNSLLQSSTSLVTITDITTPGSLVSVLNVTDVCTSITILGPRVPCQSFALSYTGLTASNLALVSALGMNVSLDTNTALLNFSGSGSASIRATPPTPSAATPEPSSLCLLATGVLGAAGMMRRKFLVR